MRNKVSKKIPDGIGAAEIDRADRTILRILSRDAAISNHCVF